MMALVVLLVIYLEENANIPEELLLILHIPNGETVHYTVPVVKLWAMTLEDLYEQKMYALIPLQVFHFRKTMLSIYNSRHPEQVKARVTSVDEFKQQIQKTQQ